ncbi:MAG: TlyA family RNA methyltransferase [Puniceicoccales bacterium]|jgi:23S rRNA (cytidine1920-2'-O)/16S rRNA (cytidine1409-2'-O)-methyltransferase|nr:TlyA family RNA methyltransferase [Puniceicoccales bacterium]
MKRPRTWIRADEWLVLNHIAETRTKAQAMIFAHTVRLSENDVIDKPSRKVPIDGTLAIGIHAPFVSRGGEKLVAFLRQFPIQIAGQDILDIGASTGGFTDCLLQNGARTATCIDVGHGQLHYKLQKDPRVVNFENINARNLTVNFFQGKRFGIAVCDVSFISLKKILPTIWPFVDLNGYLISLIKPQFEAEKHYVDRYKGIIQDPKVQESICNDIVQFACNNLSFSQLIGNMESPILGAAGNREFLFGIQKIFPNHNNEFEA